jgi:hypothetical protein
MKKILFAMLLVVAAGAASAQNYIFFLHNAFMEGNTNDAVHPSYGKCDYKGIISAFKKENFEVISEIRPSGTNVTTYAAKVVKQINDLLAKGVKPNHITVVGASKGGYIAMEVSGMLKNKNVNFVFVACCSDDEDVTFYGNVLGINEKSDGPHSCKASKDKSGGNVTKFKEVQLNTGLGHGFQFRAMREWLDPAIMWAKEQR